MDNEISDINDVQDEDEASRRLCILSSALTHLAALNQGYLKVTFDVENLDQFAEQTEFRVHKAPNSFQYEIEVEIKNFNKNTLN